MLRLRPESVNIRRCTPGFTGDMEAVLDELREGGLRAVTKDGVLGDTAFSIKMEVREASRRTADEVVDAALRGLPSPPDDPSEPTRTARRTTPHGEAGGGRPLREPFGRRRRDVHGAFGRGGGRVYVGEDAYGATAKRAVGEDVRVVRQGAPRVGRAAASRRGRFCARGDAGGRGGDGTLIDVVRQVASQGSLRIWSHRPDERGSRGGGTEKGSLAGRIGNGLVTVRERRRRIDGTSTHRPSRRRLGCEERGGLGGRGLASEARGSRVRHRMPVRVPWNVDGPAYPECVPSSARWCSRRARWT